MAYNPSSHDHTLQHMIDHQLLPSQLIRPIAVLIPAFNEADNLRQLLPAIPRQVHGLDVCVCVIDDGSTDETAEVAKTAGAMVIRSPYNAGQGHALRLGYQFVRMNFEIKFGVTLDADNQHRPEDMHELLKPVIDGQWDLSIGSRNLWRGSRNTASASGARLRRWGIAFFSWLLSRITGVLLSDCSNGYKAFNRQWIDAVLMREEQFQAAEAIIRTVRAGMRLGEVPVRVDPRQFGNTKKGTDLIYGLQFARVMTRTWFGSQ